MLSWLRARLPRNPSPERKPVAIARV